MITICTVILNRKQVQLKRIQSDDYFTQHYTLWGQHMTYDHKYAVIVNNEIVLFI